MNSYYGGRIYNQFYHDRYGIVDKSLDHEVWSEIKDKNTIG